MKGKCKINVFLPSILIASTSILFHLFSIDIHCALHSPLHCKLLYLFSHANIFHLLLNFTALFQFKPRWKTCMIAYFISVTVMFLPFAYTVLPTCGLSGFLMACFARRYYSWKISVKWILLSNLLLAFIPVFNWKVHLLCFVLSYSVYGALSKIRTYRRG